MNNLTPKKAKERGLLTRQVREGDVVTIGENVVVSFSKVRAGYLRFHVLAPKDMAVRFPRRAK